MSFANTTTLYIRELLKCNDFWATHNFIVNAGICHVLRRIMEDYELGGMAVESQSKVLALLSNSAPQSVRACWDCASEVFITRQAKGSVGCLAIWVVPNVGTQPSIKPSYCTLIKTQLGTNYARIG